MDSATIFYGRLNARSIPKAKLNLYLQRQVEAARHRAAAETFQALAAERRARKNARRRKLVERAEARKMAPPPFELGREG